MPTETRTREQTVALARHFVDAVNNRDFSIWADNLHDDYIASYPSAPSLDADGARHYNESFLPAFSDLHFEIDRCHVDGNHVVFQLMVTATHDGFLQLPGGDPIPATNKTAAAPMVAITEISDDRIRREWTYWDRMGVFGQLGLL